MSTSTGQQNQPTTKGPNPEPWMRGTHTDIHPVLRALIHSLEMAQEDVEKWCADLGEDQLNAKPFGSGSIAFHVRHAAGSMDRLLTYAEGQQLSPEQFAILKSEGEPISSRDELLSGFRDAIVRAIERVKCFDASALDHPRAIGRKQLPTTLAGLLIHTAEHTQRHIGEMIVTAKAVRNQQPSTWTNS